LWLIALAFALSPSRSLTRGTLLLGIGVGLGTAAVIWGRLGRPRPPGVGDAVARGREALRSWPVAILATCVTAALAYVIALAFFTPSNDMDALEYHLARAALWKQQHGLGHIDGVDDARVNLFPPNAEIGQLATMLLTGRDRYAALPQLLAYLMLVLSVAGLARRAALSVKEAAFAASAFATLPIVVVQASSAMNDLVVGSFLAAAAYFGLGTRRVTTIPLAAAVALAVGTKLTAFIALPTLAFVLAAGTPRRRWPRLLGAIATGCFAGSLWFVVNVFETGALGTDVPNQPNQSADLDPRAIALMWLRLALSFVDMSGAPGPYALAFLAAGAALAIAGLVEAHRSRRGGALLLSASLTAAVIAIPVLWDLVVRIPFKLALVAGGHSLADRFGWVLNTKAEPLVGGYGPLALILLTGVPVIVVTLWRRGWLPPLAVALAAAPLTLFVTMAAALSYDPTRARFLVFGVALAAATWGVALRVRSLAFATVGVGSAALFLALANYHGKPSGLFTAESIWTLPRWQAQTTRNGFGADVLGFVESRVPADARLSLAIRGDDWIHPFFGPTLSRHVHLVSPLGGTPSNDSQWLVLGPNASVVRCPGSWATAYENAAGWMVQNRVAADKCRSPGG
jgi:hypothetical protein